VLLARWLHDAPESARLREVLAAQRARAGNTELLDDRTLALAASLFGAGPGRLAPAEVEKLSEVFFAYYHPAEPFRVEALRSLWRACLEPACAQLRENGERRLAGARVRE
jgi:hypothetical protein